MYVVVVVVTTSLKVHVLRFLAKAGSIHHRPFVFAAFTIAAWHLSFVSYTEPTRAIGPIHPSGCQLITWMAMPSGNFIKFQLIYMDLSDSDFVYSAETFLSSPILQHVEMIWNGPLSPSLGSTKTPASPCLLATSAQLRPFPCSSVALC